MIFKQLTSWHLINECSYQALCSQNISAIELLGQCNIYVRRVSRRKRIFSNLIFSKCVRIKNLYYHPVSRSLSSEVSLSSTGSHFFHCWTCFVSSVAEVSLEGLSSGVS
uniref:Uncharacterized protein n=1 Tax=Micrurus surinamensis TaxID=129470 RepID=A0A2D4NKF0_MICSU